ncbi:MAG: type II toxin-antitoxin system PemK/MazF family toxin [Limisphaerales bacterium]
MNINRYAIYLADLNPTQGGEMSKTRPIAVVRRSRVQIKCAGKPAEIAVDQIRTISKSRLIRKLDFLFEKNAAQLRHLISEMYGE